MDLQPGENQLLGQYLQCFPLGQAVAYGAVAQQHDVTGKVFGGAEDGMHELPGGIIDSSYQADASVLAH
ncbi:MAG TPA: hypothetical protein VFI02_20355 [Armatimonadota bacterium]|nr:hypothetical protein [Armatimonadota bacterium]